MKVHTFRLHPGADLKASIEAFVRGHAIEAGYIITCVGGLRQATLRLAGATPAKQDIQTYTAHFEITSLVGTVSRHGMHLHMSVSDSDGHCFGGHLKEGTVVDPTAEIVIGESDDTTYTRKMDEETGFNELVITT
jgi:uncharacterized protein